MPHALRQNTLAANLSRGVGAASVDIWRTAYGAGRMAQLEEVPDRELEDRALFIT